MPKVTKIKLSGGDIGLIVKPEEGEHFKLKPTEANLKKIGQSIDDFYEKKKR